MGIEEEFQLRRDQEREAAEKASALDDLAARVAPMLRGEFHDFLSALAKYGVEPHVVVAMKREHFLAKTGLFGRYKAAYSTFVATEVGRCWVFRSLLLFDDGRIAKRRNSPWNVGKIESWANEWHSGTSDKENVRAAAAHALSAAGLGSEVTNDYLFVSPEFEFEFVSWAELKCKPAWDGGTFATLWETKFKLVADGWQLIRRGVDNEESVRLSSAFADYIEGMGRHHSVMGYS
ncbi:hypothetical protein [Paenarthrobacter sp. YJN-5]|uniref:hypothetical protein n=1 Tax=Paenarthrobacter sp. YJN-5 TaxID=2735316 RepID=UPI001878F1A3|nr:hypothetical protein [Paenarthrobacter sp. YJN-5]QOT19284.1 hypothetical protein HMI59_21525 [Paenarthrobacter sp. YJN-5]